MKAWDLFWKQYKEALFAPHSFRKFGQTPPPGGGAAFIKRRSKVATGQRPDFPVNQRLAYSA